MARKTRTWEDARIYGSNTVHQRRRVPAGEARERKERLPASVRDMRAAYAKRDRGEKLTWRDKQLIAWASPQKSAEQRAKTGDDFIPRGEAIGRARIRAYGRRGRSSDARTNVKKTFTGRGYAERGAYEEYYVPDPDQPGRQQVKISHRVRRAFDWVTTPAKPAKPVKAAGGRHRAPDAPRVAPLSARQRSLSTVAELRAHAGALGVQLPARAGRNQIIAAIDHAQTTPGYSY